MAIGSILLDFRPGHTEYSARPFIGTTTWANTQYDGSLKHDKSCCWRNNARQEILASFGHVSPPCASEACVLLLVYRYRLPTPHLFACHAINLQSAIDPHQIGLREPILPGFPDRVSNVTRLLLLLRLQASKQAINSVDLGRPAI